MNKRIPEYLAKKTTNVYLLMFVTFFSLFFVNVYTPFQDAGWFNDSQYQATSFYSTLCSRPMVMLLSSVFLL